MSGDERRPAARCDGASARRATARERGEELTDALGRLATACGMICGVEAEFIGITKELEAVRKDAERIVMMPETSNEQEMRCAQAILAALTWLTPTRRDAASQRERR